MAEAHDRLLRKLESVAALTDDEKGAIARLPFKTRDVAQGITVMREGDRPSNCCLVLEGLLCSYNDVPDGGRQITSFFVPGDVPDLQSLHLKTLDYSIGALTKSRLACVEHSAMIEIAREHPGVATALWRESLIIGCLTRQWVVNTGRRNAYTRIAHTLCELFVRLRAVGLAEEDGFELPLTQSELGDAAGLSTVHVNRVLQELRADEVVVIKTRRVHFPDWSRFCEAGQFDPTYLHLSKYALTLLPQ